MLTEVFIKLIETDNINAVYQNVSKLKSFCAIQALLLPLRLTLIPHNNIMQSKVWYQSVYTMKFGNSRRETSSESRSENKSDKPGFTM